MIAPSSGDSLTGIPTSNIQVVMGEFVTRDNIDWDEGSQPVLIGGPVPEPSTITVDVRPALRKIRAEEELSVALVYGDVTVSSMRLKGLEEADVDIGTEYSALILESVHGGNKIRRVALVENPIGQDPKMIAYVDATEEEETAVVCSSLYQQINDGLEGPLSDLVQAIRDSQDDVGIDVAVWVSTEERGKGRGRLIWHLACAVNELRGLENMRIRGDLTVGQHGDRPGASFYEYLGANPCLFFDLNLWDGNTLEYSSSLDLRGPTTLTDRQVQYLRNAVRG